ncbi:unnamed protein product [Auanema sp. JU1783]|nr:unnamed protein product [Auanema sp. JU1783]
MAETTEVNFHVRVPDAAAWEHVFIVGSHEKLGNWIAAQAYALNRKENEIFEAVVSFPNSVSEVFYRYIVGSYLDAADGTENKKLIINRWESILKPRRCMPKMQTKLKEDVFGSYDGKKLISNGWISQADEHVVLLRIHGEALKFYKPRFKEREHRLKVVPFDVRFREIYSYYTYASRPSLPRKLLWRLSSVYQASKDSVDEDNVPENERDPTLPEVPSFSSTELSVLTREDPIFGEQYVNGSVFRNNTDYLVFKTRSVSIEHLAFRIELYHNHTRIGIAYALPAALPDTYGKITFPIISTHHTPIGQIDVDYMLVKHLPIEVPLRDCLAKSYGKHWRKRQTLEVGHRGMGSSYTKCANFRENTIHSLNEAARKGADYVEFDVQLTKDLVPIVYHDFHVLVEVTSRSVKGFPLNGEHKHHQMAIKDLKLSQLNLLHLEHLAHSTVDENTLRVVPSEADTSDDLLNPFPTLDTVLGQVDDSVGFNIEVKYPMSMKDGTHECAGYFERNVFVDTILTSVFKHARDRRILFSSFDPDICTLISQKQHTFPVLFLVVGETARYIPFEDIRSDSSKIAVHYAAASSLLGVNFHSEELLKDRTPLQRADKYNLVSFVWGDDLNTKDNQEFFKKELKVDGLIYDRIGEDGPRQNVFVVEREQRAALFSQPPSPRVSRRNSLVDKEKDNCIVRISRKEKDTSPHTMIPSPRRSNSLFHGPSTPSLL